MIKKRIYGITRTASSGGGHGDPGVSLRGVMPLGCYGEDGIPPMFANLEAAEAYMMKMESTYNIQIRPFELWIDE